MLSVSGFATTTGFSLLETKGDWRASLKNGGISAASGFVFGAIAGASEGFKEAKRLNENPWNGQDIDYTNISARDLGLSETVDRVKRNEMNPSYKHDGERFENRESILPTSKYEYKAYIHPTPGISGPGHQRIVVGGNNWYYTPDHYHTFIKFKP